MKNLKSLALGLTAVIAASAMTSCDSDEPASQTVINISNPSVTYNAEGYWDKCYDAAYDNKLTFDGVQFSHSAMVTEWEGVKYYSWKGFCPTICDDNADHSEDWITYQWGSIAGGAVTLPNAPYMLGCWDVNEPTNSIPADPSCKMTMAGGTFSPVEVYVTNSAYGYYVMRDGNTFCKKFTESDWCMLHIHGLLNGQETGAIDFNLANGTDILDHWARLDLTALGTVDAIYFQMSSSDSSQWGMNTPAYFCLDQIRIAQ